jgi:hypothetical protein
MSTEKKKQTARPSDVDDAPASASLLESVADVTLTPVEPAPNEGVVRERASHANDALETVAPIVRTRIVEAPEVLFAPRWPTLRRDSLRAQRPRPPRVTPITTVPPTLRETPWHAERTGSTSSRSVAASPVRAAESLPVLAELRRVRHLFLLGLLAIALAATVLVGAVVLESVAAVAPTAPQ